MFSSLNNSVIRQLDKLVLYTMNQRVPESLQTTYQDTPAFETVLAQTAVDLSQTPDYLLSAPGEHAIQLNTMLGPITCHVRVRPARDPHAPLLIYHHGFSEMPYYGSWQRLFPKNHPYPVHSVCIQAPYHDHWRAPFEQSMASVLHIYQTFAGSVRLIELMQNHFEANGAPYTILAGVSWGGITSLLYEGLFQRAATVIPMLSSPDLAQVLLDIAELFGRPIDISRRELKQMLDFSPYFERCSNDKVYPLLGEKDLFFRYENHQHHFANCQLNTISQGHISGFFHIAPLRQHLAHTLQHLVASHSPAESVHLPITPQPVG
ncbi:MAG: hypothetical protein KDE56_30525 [Anaerolineales bacterium]|nr:hypothetical protein [Anaerolineales bacterium]